MHALYGFARYADEIVDDTGSGLSPAERALALADWGERFFGYLAAGRCDDPVLAAVVHTVRSFGIDQADFRAFLSSMAMDLTVTSYASYDDLLGYMEGSAAAIGAMMLPVLESADPARAREPARQLGLAFQLTNFIRDVGEDLRRGRIYLPAADLDRFGVTPADLGRPEPTPAVRDLLAFECARARAHYQAALPGVAALAPSSQPVHPGRPGAVRRHPGRTRAPRLPGAAWPGPAVPPPQGGDLRASPDGRHPRRPPRAESRRQAARVVTRPRRCRPARCSR